jgi:hypothetical protein
MRRFLSSVLCGAIAIILLVVRAPDAFWVPQFWAEDGSVFWLEEYKWGVWKAFSIPTNGYLAAAARLIAAFATFFPYDLHPTVFLGGVCAFTVWTVTTIAGVSLPLAMAVLLGLSIMVVPHSCEQDYPLLSYPCEIWANATNVHWVLATALPLIAVTLTPTSRLARINQVAFVAIAGLSGPFSILATPLWIWRAVRSARDHVGLTIAAVGVATAAIQAYVIATSPVPSGAHNNVSVRSLDLAWIVARRWLSDDPFLVRSYLIAALVLVSLVATSLVGSYRRLRAACVVYGAAILAAVVWKYQVYWVAWEGAGHAVRYFYLPVCMIMFCAISLLFEGWLPAKFVGAGVAALLLISSVQSGFVRPVWPDLRHEWLEKTPLIGKEAVIIGILPDPKSG